MLIRLCRCAGWSAPLLFAYVIRHVFAWPGPYSIINLHHFTGVNQSELSVFLAGVHDGCHWACSVPRESWEITLEILPADTRRHLGYLCEAQMGISSGHRLWYLSAGKEQNRTELYWHLRSCTMMMYEVLTNYRVWIRHLYVRWVRMYYCKKNEKENEKIISGLVLNFIAFV